MAAVPAAGEHEKKLRMMRSSLVQNAELTSAKQKAPGMPGRIKGGGDGEQLFVAFSILFLFWK